MVLNPVRATGQDRISVKLTFEPLAIDVHPALGIESRFALTAVDLDAHSFAGCCVFRGARPATPHRYYQVINGALFVRDVDAVASIALKGKVPTVRIRLMGERAEEQEHCPSGDSHVSLPSSAQLASVRPNV